MYGYGVRRWNEEAVIKWLAVGMILAMIGLAVMPAMTVGHVVGVLYAAGVVNDRGAVAASLVGGGEIAIGSGIWALYGEEVVLLGLTGAALGGAILIGAGVGLL